VNPLPRAVTGRRAAATLGIVAALALGGCSSEGAVAGGSAVSVSGSASAGQGEEVTTRPAPGVSVGASPEPETAARTVDGLTAAKASKDVGATFAPVTRSAGTVVTGTALRTVVVDGRTVGGVAVYSVPTESAVSPVFRDQFLAQLVGVLVPANEVSRARISGTDVVLGRGDRPVAGWFTGGRVHVLRQDRATPPVQDVVATLIAHPPVAPR